MRMLPLAVLLVACGGNVEDAADTDGTDIAEDTSATVDTAPTDGEEHSIDGAFWGVTGRFAFDAATGMHVPYVEAGGGPTPISIAVTLVDSSIQETGILDASTSCTVTLEYDGQLPTAPWVATHLQWAGFDLPANPTVLDGCRNYFGLPQEFGGEVGAAVASWSWGIGLGDMDDYVKQQLQASVSPSEWAALEPNLVGGAILNPLFAVGTSDTGASPDGFSNSGFALGYEVDGNFEVEVGGTGVPIPLSREAIHAEDDPEPGVATGYYEVLMGYWTNSAVLAPSGG